MRECSCNGIFPMNEYDATNCKGRTLKCITITKVLQKFSRSEFIDRTWRGEIYTVPKLLYIIHTLLGTKNKDVVSKVNSIIRELNSISEEDIEKYRKYDYRPASVTQVTFWINEILNFFSRFDEQELLVVCDELLYFTGENKTRKSEGNRKRWESIEEHIKVSETWKHKSVEEIELWKKHISESLKIHFESSEARQKVSDGLKNRTQEKIDLWKKHLSESSKGNHNWGDVSGTNNPMFGKHRSKESRRKQGKTRKENWRKLDLMRKEEVNLANSRAQKKRYENIEARAKTSAASKQAWANKTQEQLDDFSKKQYEAQNRQEVKEAKSIIMKKLWENPERHKRVCESLKRTWANKTQEEKDEINKRKNASRWNAHRQLTLSQKQEVKNKLSSGVSKEQILDEYKISARYLEKILAPPLTNPDWEQVEIRIG